MPDFLIVIDPEFAEESDALLRLRNRPTMESVQVARWRFKWGVVLAQEPRCAGYTPCVSDNGVTLSLGRPRLLRQVLEPLQSQGFNRVMSNLLSENDVHSTYDDITGCFVIAHMTERQILILTDRLGSYPVYESKAERGVRTVIGTHPDLVARFAGRYSDWDPLSLAELIVRESITYPYTTRKGMREIGPGRLHSFQISADGEILKSERILWLPKEPERWPSEAEAFRRLESALRSAGDDITAGCSKVGVTLSAGIDSRTVLSVIPRERLSAAFTFCDQNNWESNTAAAVARSRCVPHHILLRSPQLYADMVSIEPQLVGIERGSVNGHTFPLSSSDVARECDVVVCGFLSDTLLKGWFARHPVYNEVSFDCMGKPALELALCTRKISNCIKSEILDAMADRWRVRLAEVRAIRPSSYNEWVSFYPLSRQQHFSYAAVSQRALKSEQLFLHRDVCKAACEVPQSIKDPLSISTNLFSCICGDLAQIPVSGSRQPMIRDRGVQATLSNFVHRISRRMERYVQKYKKVDGWFTDHSWIDLQRFQEQSKQWQQIRSSTESNHSKALASVLIPSIGDFTQKYQSEFLPETNYTIMKLLISMSEDSSVLTSPIPHE